MLAAPVLLAGVATIAGLKLFGSSPDRVREQRTPQTLLIALVALIPLTWLIIRVAGEETSGSGGTCPAINDGPAAGILVSLCFGSAILGGVAFAASLVAHPHSWKAGAYALAALAVPYVLGAMYLLEALCWV